jgi:hypothetical protein
MEMAAYGVLKNPGILEKLRQELLEAFPNPNADLSFIKLEKLPYLVSSHPSDRLANKSRPVW